jgi:predicted transcriptional regulator
MTVYLVVPLDKETSKALERLAASSLGITVEALAAEAIESFVSNRQDAQRRIAEGAFLFNARGKTLLSKVESTFGADDVD